ncbi:sulfite oxidase heme-binding subunit YedZ [Pararhodobacter oceanensis]|uniref:sulfite oxidase heme-binding subunit YedZ n=1 Tax=Pararhodobacter oceanensis TaxID=2172121 RepID=UPI003A90C292
MSRVQRFLNHPYAFWLLLSLPAIPMVSGLASGGAEAVEGLLHPTGEFAARFMIIAMMITPLTMLFQGWRFPRWLMKRRRYLGVAAFGYAALHTALYLMDIGAVAVTTAEISKLYIWTGWLALLIFVPLAITSTDGWMRRLGRRWKPLQRYVYAAAVLTLLHWAALHDWGGIAPALVHFLPLALLEAYRLWAYRARRSARRVA